jgi:hypothetical protein
VQRPPPPRRARTMTRVPYARRCWTAPDSSCVHAAQDVESLLPTGRRSTLSPRTPELGHRWERDR